MRLLVSAKMAMVDPMRVWAKWEQMPDLRGLERR